MTSPRTADGIADWQEHYRRRLVTAEEAVKQIKSGDNVWVSLGQRVTLLLSALLGRVDEVEGVQVSGGLIEDLGWFNEAIRPHIGTNIVFAAPTTRAAVNERQAGYIPWWVWGAHKALDEGRPGARPIDVALIAVTPPNRAGYCCFGNILWDAKTTARRARMVVAVVNEAIARTFGDTWISASEIDWFVEQGEPFPARALPSEEPQLHERPIAEYVASLINNGDTIQIGTGTTTGAIPNSGVLDTKEDLGYFAELTVAGTIDLVRKGVITSKRMATHPGKFVTTMAGTGPDDVAFIDENPMFEFYSVDYMHHPGAIARNDNMVAINNALSVDLTGQIAAGHIGPRVHSGTGGQLAYALGALMSRGGRSITVLPSTTLGGSVSRIVPQFERGQIVTVPRDFADIVITEYGIAHLLNKTQRERAEELIAIAHPDFRAELRQEVDRLF